MIASVARLPRDWHGPAGRVVAVLAMGALRVAVGCGGEEMDARASAAAGSRAARAVIVRDGSLPPVCFAAGEVADALGDRGHRRSSRPGTPCRPETWKAVNVWNPQLAPVE